MPASLYHANVAFGANITGYFVIQANSVQDAASLAVRAYDQNASVQLANGDSRYRGNTAGIVNNVANTEAQAIVYVKDPANQEFPAKAWEVKVNAARIIAPTIATYGANGAPAVLSTTGA